MTARAGIGNVTFSPLAHGMLTGKYVPGASAPAVTRAVDPETNQVMMEMYWKEEYKRKSQSFLALAREAGLGAAQLAVAWCLRRPEVSSVILGVRSVGQLEENLAAVAAAPGADLLKKLEELFPAPQLPFT